jgi:hypothetical protein
VSPVRSGSATATSASATIRGAQHGAVAG